MGALAAADGRGTNRRRRTQRRRRFAAFAAVVALAFVVVARSGRRWLLELSAVVSLAFVTFLFPWLFPWYLMPAGALLAVGPLSRLNVCLLVSLTAIFNRRRFALGEAHFPMSLDDEVERSGHGTIRPVTAPAAPEVPRSLQLGVGALLTIVIVVGWGAGLSWGLWWLDETFTVWQVDQGVAAIIPHKLGDSRPISVLFGTIEALCYFPGSPHMRGHVGAAIDGRRGGVLLSHLPAGGVEDQ